MAPMAWRITLPSPGRRSMYMRVTRASQARGSLPMSAGARPAMAADTPTPPNDSLYSLQPTRPSSVVILRKSKFRCPASACSDSIFAIFICGSYHVARREDPGMPVTHFDLVLRRPIAEGRIFDDAGPYE